MHDYLLHSCWEAQISMFMKMDETIVGCSVSPNKDLVQSSMTTEVPPTQHAPTTLTDNVERLERKIDDRPTEVGDFTRMVCAIMQHLVIDVSHDYFIFFMLLIYMIRVLDLWFLL